MFWIINKFWSVSGQTDVGNEEMNLRCLGKYLEKHTYYSRYKKEN